MKERFLIRYGTLGGTITVMLCNISLEELMKIALSAAIGTIVSVGISFLMRRIIRGKPQK
jgi:putative flippase GtrA